MFYYLRVFCLSPTPPRLPAQLKLTGATVDSLGDLSTITHYSFAKFTKHALIAFQPYSVTSGDPPPGAQPAEWLARLMTAGLAARSSLAGIQLTTLTVHSHLKIADDAFAFDNADDAFAFDSVLA